MNAFDLSIIQAINQLSRISWSFDHAMVFLASAHLLKGGLFMLALWWLWFRTGAGSQTRGHVISTLFSAFTAIAAGRILALSLPYRARPLHETAFEFLPPHGMAGNFLEGWSSFPSDHAVLFFALSTSLFFLSRKVGVIAFAYAILFISFPRVYLGFHYPTDILAGAAIGIAIAFAGNSKFIKRAVAAPALRSSMLRPGVFYPVLFFATFQIAEMFESTRDGVKFVNEVRQHIFFPITVSAVVTP